MRAENEKIPRIAREGKRKNEGRKSRRVKEREREGRRGRVSEKGRHLGLSVWNNHGWTHAVNVPEIYDGN